MSAIPLKFLRELNVSAASGLLRTDGQFRVIADDDLSLRIFSDGESSPIQSMALMLGSLPEEKKARKKTKPDFETLLYFPTKNSFLAIPSGSKPNRVFGAEVVGAEVQRIDFSALFEFLTKEISELNIEGSAIVDEKILLFQRGNGAKAQNGIVSLHREIFEGELAQAKLTEKSFVNYQELKVGELQGCPLSFTDAAVETSEKIWFLAAAEGGQSTFEDGAFLGAVLGCMDSKFNIFYHSPLNCPEKPEGLALDLDQGKFFVVTDADDRTQYSKLFEGLLPKI